MPEFSSVQSFRVGNLALSLVSGDGTPIPPAPENLRPFEIEEAQPVVFKVYTSKPPWAFSIEEADFTQRYWSFKRVGEDWLFRVMFLSNAGQKIWIRYTTAQPGGEVYFQDPPAGKLNHPLSHPSGTIIIVALLNASNGLSVHSCGVLKDGKVYLFSGSSGVGKTTSARLWDKVPGARVLSDERILLIEREGRIWAYGTPWHGEMSVYSNLGGPVAGIFFLHHDTQNEAVPLNQARAGAKVLARAYMAHWDPQKLAQNVDFASRVAQMVPCYDYGFLPDASAVDYIECMK